MPKTDISKGLTSQEAARRLTQFGRNEIAVKRRMPLALQFFKQFKDLMVIILIIAGVIAYAVGEKTDASIIIGIVLLNATIGFLQEFKAERAIEALKKLLSPKARVLRDGIEEGIPVELLVPGDIVILAEGDRVPADCELFEENELLIDEAILTGESVPVVKDTHENRTIFMGTQVAHGTGRARVQATGMKTQFGRIASLTSETKKDRSPLQKELGTIGVLVGKITIAISAILFLVGFLLQKRPLVETFLFAVSVAVAAVPEGLPTTITVALALGVQRLARKNAIVKQLSSVETLGSTTVICSDKTGTLTKNEMTVKEIFFDDYEVQVNGVGYDPIGSFSVHGHAKQPYEYFEYEKENLHQFAYRNPLFYEQFERLSRAMLLCNNARLSEIQGQWKILGDPTEGALTVACEKAGFSFAAVTAQHKRIFEIPFNSARKRMSVIAQDSTTRSVSAYAKGAPDSLIPLCAKWHTPEGVRDFEDEHKRFFLERSEQIAQKALRTIALAYKPLSREIQAKYNKYEIENDLIFLGIVGMIDPPRDEVKEAVKLTHKAGIRVFIITGDHGLTAHAIAKELGISQSFGVNIITGELLEKMSDAKLTQLLAPGQETIFARVSPEHKLRIVDALKKSGAVVAVTGDGVNDAPALKRADIGVAMGITGTDVSKEAANMVLADDSFSTIVTAIIEGRTIYENMKKFIYFIFSSNIGELIAIFGTLLLGLPAPFTAVLILIINTLTDVFPSLALGVEPVEKSILERPPRKPEDRIMNWEFARRYLGSGVFIGLATVAVFVWNLLAHGWRFGEGLSSESALYFESATLAFVFLTFVQMAHAFNSRSAHESVFSVNPLRNKALIGAVLFSILGTIAIVELPFFQRYLSTTDLTLKEWLVIAAASLSIIMFEEIRKVFMRMQNS